MNSDFTNDRLPRGRETQTGRQLQGFLIRRIVTADSTLLPSCSADTTWSGLDSLMDQKIASAYDQAASRLEELRDAYTQAGATGGFQQKLAALRLRYSNRPAMLRRIKEL